MKIILAGQTKTIKVSKVYGGNSSHYTRTGAAISHLECEDCKKIVPVEYWHDGQCPNCLAAEYNAEYNV